jgi:hypothetical protein
LTTMDDPTGIRTIFSSITSPIITNPLQPKHS